MNLILFVGCSSSGQTPSKCKRIFYITSRFFYRPAQKKSFSRRHDALWEAQMTPEEAALKQWDRHRQVLFQRTKTLYVSYGNDSKCAVFLWCKSMFYVDATPGGSLAKKCQRILSRCDLSVKVMKKTGHLIKKAFSPNQIRSNPEHAMNQPVQWDCRIIVGQMA